MVQSLYQWQRLWRSIINAQSELEWLPLMLINGLLLGLFLALRQAALLQPLELVAYDQMLRWRSPQPPDTRILVVEITQPDLDSFPDSLITDAAFAHLLATLQRYQPVAIGIDIFLEPPIPPGTAELQAQLRRPNVISITSLGNNAIERKPPPSYLPPQKC